jgi:hypothetical protein
MGFTTCIHEIIINLLWRKATSCAGNRPLSSSPSALCRAILPEVPQFFAKRPSAVEILNDLNGELINFYQVVKKNLIN